MKKYSIRYKGEFRYADEKGQITTENWNTPTGQWIIVGLTFYWNSRSYTPWETIKQRLDSGESITGYVFDRDHGTLRQWGGGGNNKATFQKIG